MFKLIIMVVLANNETTIAKIAHPWEFQDEATCRSFVKEQQWGVQYNEKLITVYPKCSKVAEKV